MNTSAINSTEVVEIIMLKLLAWMRVFVTHIPNIVLEILILIFFYFFSKVGTNFFRERLKSSKTLNLALQSLLVSILKTGLILLGIFLALTVVGLEKLILSLLAGVGIIGLALGFAFRDLAANIISGIFMAVNEPAKYGDWISLKDVSGTLIRINLRDMVIKTADGEIVRVPNKDYMSNSITNFNSLGQRRISIEFDIRFEDDFARIKNELLDKISQIPEIIDTPQASVTFEKFSQSTVTYKLQCWINYPKSSFLETKTQAAQVIKNLMSNKTIGTLYPVRNIMDCGICVCPNEKCSSRENRLPTHKSK